MAWFRMWDDMLDSRKHNMLPASIGWAWVQFMACANRHDYRGGTLPPMEDLTFWLRKTEQQIEDMLVECINLGLIEQAGGVFTVHNWHHWQRPADPTAANRKAKQRATEKAKPGHKRDTHRDTDRDTKRDINRDTNRDARVTVTGEEENLKNKGQKEETRTPPVGGVSGGQTHDPDDLRRLYEVIDEATGGGANHAAMMANVKAKPWPVASWIEGWRRVGSMTAKPGKPWPYVVSIIEGWPNGIPPETPAPTLRIAGQPPAVSPDETARLEAEADARREKRAAMIEAQLAEQARRKAGVA
jgi:hypothetical protein